MKGQITDRLLAGLPPLPRDQAQLRVFDTVLSGFIAEQRQGGVTLYLRYRDERRRVREVKLGRVGEVTIAQARKRAESLKAEVALGGDPLAARDAKRAIPTVARFVADQFLPHAENRQRSIGNTRGYARRIVDRLGRKGMDEVTPGDVAEFRAWLMRQGLANGTVNRHLAALRHMMNLAIRWRLVSGPNPAAAPGMLREVGRDLYLNADQIAALFAALREEEMTPASLAIAILAVTGARRDEVLHARWADLDLDRRLLTVPLSKSGRTRHIALPDPAIQAFAWLAARRQPGEAYIFPGRREGKPMVELRGTWRKVRRKAGLPPAMRLHDLRHCFASVLVNTGVPLNEVGALLGHSDLKMTARYAHHAPQRLVETANRAARAWNLLSVTG